MELYRKKLNIENKKNKKGRDRNIREENNPKKKYLFTKNDSTISTI